MKRRTFLQAAGTASTAGAVHPILAGLNRTGELKIPSGTSIVFQGDSITDAGRDRGSYYANNAKGLGGGYVYQIVSDLLGQHPKSDLQCFNRGISGHKVFQLADRWDIDCLYLKPDVLSILIGVNDYWHMLNDRYDGTVKIYATDFRALLKRTREALPNVKLMIGEPFAVRGGTAIDEKWAPFDEYRNVAKEIADEFGGIFIPFHSMFDDALSIAPAAYWCPDGVHPSVAGAHLMKNAWLEGFADAMK